MSWPPPPTWNPTVTLYRHIHTRSRTSGRPPFRSTQPQTRYLSCLALRSRRRRSPGPASPPTTRTITTYIRITKHPVSYTHRLSRRGGVGFPGLFCHHPQSCPVFHTRRRSDSSCILPHQLKCICRESQSPATYLTHPVQHQLHRQHRSNSNNASFLASTCHCTARLSGPGLRPSIRETSHWIYTACINALQPHLQLPCILLPCLGSSWLVFNGGNDAATSPRTSASRLWH